MRAQTRNRRSSQVPTGGWYSCLDHRCATGLCCTDRELAIQSAWPSRDVFHEFAVDYAESRGDDRRPPQLDVLSAGSVVPPFQSSDAVHGGILDGSHGGRASVQQA
jgi:TRAP-type mannitol/chloroaromatic compound transport system substrate-binding protein